LVSIKQTLAASQQFIKMGSLPPFAASQHDAGSAQIASSLTAHSGPSLTFGYAAVATRIADIRAACSICLWIDDRFDILPMPKTGLSTVSLR